MFYLELSVLVGDGVAVAGLERHGTLLAAVLRTPTLALDPRTVVRVDFVADAVRRTDRQVLLAILASRKKKQQTNKKSDSPRCQLGPKRPPKAQKKNKQTKIKTMETRLRAEDAPRFRFR